MCAVFHILDAVLDDQMYGCFDKTCGFSGIGHHWKHLVWSFLHIYMHSPLTHYLFKEFTTRIKTEGIFVLNIAETCSSSEPTFNTAMLHVMSLMFSQTFAGNTSGEAQSLPLKFHVLLLSQMLPSRHQKQLTAKLINSPFGSIITREEHKPTVTQTQRHVRCEEWWKKTKNRIGYWCKQQQKEELNEGFKGKVAEKTVRVMDGVTSVTTPYSSPGLCIFAFHPHHHEHTKRQANELCASMCCLHYWTAQWQTQRAPLKGRDSLDKPRHCIPGSLVPQRCRISTHTSGLVASCGSGWLTVAVWLDELMPTDF